MNTFKSPLPIFTVDNDNPTTCPECGNRTDIEFEISKTEQHHKCLSCDYEFIIIIDVDE